MLVITANQKGGAGKSTLTLLLANYLSLLKNRNVTVIDMDYQQSIAEKFNKARVIDSPPPYQVIAASLEDFPDLHGTIKEAASDIVLLDLPGKLDDDGLIPVFAAADLVICPFAYDELSYQSTVLFSVVLKKLNSKAPLIYIPNRIKANVRYELIAEIDRQLANFGKVYDAVPDRIDFQRVTTVYTPQSVQPVIEPLFTALYHQYFNT